MTMQDAPSDSSKEDWSYEVNIDVAKLGDAHLHTPNNHEVDLNHQMATTFHHTFQAFEAAQEESIKHTSEEIRQDPFIFDLDMDLDSSYDRGDALIEAIPEPSIEDPRYLKLAIEIYDSFISRMWI